MEEVSPEIFIWYRVPYNCHKVEDAVAVEVLEVRVENQWRTKLKLNNGQTNGWSWTSTRAYMEHYYPSMKEVYALVIKRIKDRADNELKGAHTSIERALKQIKVAHESIPGLTVQREEAYREADYLEAVMEAMTDKELAIGVKTEKK